MERIELKNEDNKTDLTGIIPRQGWFITPQNPAMGSYLIEEEEEEIYEEGLTFKVKKKLQFDF